MPACDVDSKGHGEGKLLYASRIVAKPGQKLIQIENYATEAVMLENVSAGK